MARAYKRIPLTVDVIFMADGTLKPRRIVIKEGVYHISRILNVRHFCPSVVPCVAPLEYTVLVEGNEKKIYFEPHSNMWFSVKEAYQ